MTVAASEGHTAAYTYDENGNLTAVTDRCGNATNYEYVASDRLAKVIDALGSERIEQCTECGNGNWERTLYVHEDVMGNTRYYTKTNDQSFAELAYDAWGMPASPNKLLNNDHGNYVFATFTGHIYDTMLDICFVEARFYDAGNRQWMSIDLV